MVEIWKKEKKNRQSQKSKTEMIVFVCEREREREEETAVLNVRAMEGERFQTVRTLLQKNIKNL